MKSTSAYMLLPLLAGLAIADANPGCYASLDGTTSDQAEGSNLFLAHGLCADRCMQQRGATVAALKGDECFCLGGLPSESEQVGEDQCDTPCAGFPADMCGGENAYTVITTAKSSGSGGGGAGESSSATQEPSELSGSPATAWSGIPVTALPSPATYTGSVPPTVTASLPISSVSITSIPAAPTNSIPVAGAMPARASAGAVAAALGLGVVYNLL